MTRILLGLGTVLAFASLGAGWQEATQRADLAEREIAFMRGEVRLARQLAGAASTLADQAHEHGRLCAAAYRALLPLSPLLQAQVPAPDADMLWQEEY